MIDNPYLAEALGTLTLTLFGCGTCANVCLKGSKGHGDGWLCIATGWFLAVVLGVFVAQSAGSINADINPAVSLGKYMLGTYTIPQLLTNMLAQCVGGCLGAMLVWLVYLSQFAATTDENSIRAVFCTAPAIRHNRNNFITEFIGTIILVFGVGALFGKATLGHPVTGLGPYLVGLLVWGIGIALGGPTGYAINPARDLGPRIAHHLLPIQHKGSSQWDYAWIPVAAPLLGGLAGAILWKVIL